MAGPQEGEDCVSVEITRKKRRKKINWFRVILILIIIALAVGLAFSLKSVKDLQKEQKELQKSNKSLKAQKEQLQNELKHVNDKDYIEQQARKQLRLVKPGEVLYILDDDGNSSSGSAGNSGSDGN